MKEEKNSGNQSLIRGLRLIDLLSHYPNGCPLAKLAELSGLNKSTVHRLLQGLQQEGFIQAATTAGSYRLTTKCLAIGHKMFSSMNIIHLASPYLESLNLKIGETVNLSMRENDHAIMIYKLEPTTGMLRTRAYIGQRLNLYCSGMGKLYLAFDKKASTYLMHYWVNHQANIQQLTCHTITDINLMRKVLDEIRAQGFALDKEENELGVTCIAYPIFNFKNEVDYALSVSMSVSRLAQIGTDFLHEAVKETAIAISQALGWQNDLQKNPEI